MTKNDKKLNPQVIQGLEIAPRLQQYKTNPLTTAPSWLTLTLAFTMPLPTKEYDCVLANYKRDREGVHCKGQASYLMGEGIYHVASCFI